MKIRKDIYFHETDIDFINYIVKENNLKTFTSGLQHIIDEYRKSLANNSLSDTLAQSINDEFDRRHKNELTRIRLAGSTSDRNVQVLLEMINTLLISSNITEYFDTDTVSAPAYDGAKETVKSRIDNYKQLKDNKNKGTENK